MQAKTVTSFVERITSAVPLFEIAIVASILLCCSVVRHPETEWFVDASTLNYGARDSSHGDCQELPSPEANPIRLAGPVKIENHSVPN